MHSVGRRFFYEMRSEGAGAARESIAIGLGIFIGCLPVFGLHLAACFVVGWLLGLNRLKMWVAANISNPLFAPTLLLAELQVGSFLRRGTLHPVTLETVRTTSLWVFGIDLAVGSVAVGVTLGCGAAALTYASVRSSGADPDFLDLVRAASDRYLTGSITAWEFARGKLRSDPMYRAIVCGGLLPSGGTLLDIGCGSGLTLALLAEARTRAKSGTWPAAWGTPPIFNRLVGLDIRPRVVSVARAALGSDAEVFEGDVREAAPSGSRVVLICDVLQMIPFEAQALVISAARRSLSDGGVLVVREADASAGWRFSAVRIGNRIKAVAFGHWRQRFYFRSETDWRAMFAANGLAVAALPDGQGTPFASVLFRLTVASVASASDRAPVHVG